MVRIPGRPVEEVRYVDPLTVRVKEHHGMDVDAAADPPASSFQAGAVPEKVGRAFDADGEVDDRPGGIPGIAVEPMCSISQWELPELLIHAAACLKWRGQRGSYGTNTLGTLRKTGPRC